MNFNGESFLSLPGETKRDKERKKEREREREREKKRYSS